MAAETEIRTGVYCIRNKANGKVYVGSAALSLKMRLYEHRRCLVAGKSHNKYLQKSWDKYGADAFEFLILERCPVSECVGREQYWMDQYRATERDFGYNLSPVAGSQLGFRHTEETKAKVSAANKARSQESRERHAALLRGRKDSEETKAKKSASLKAAYANGKRKVGHSEEARAKIGAAHRGKVLSSETRAKIGAARRGHPVSAETRAKIGAANSIALKGKKLSAELRARLSVVHRGRKRKSSVGQLEFWA